MLLYQVCHREGSSGDSERIYHGIKDWESTTDVLSDGLEDYAMFCRHENPDCFTFCTNISQCIFLRLGFHSAMKVVTISTSDDDAIRRLAIPVGNSDWKFLESHFDRDIRNVYLETGDGNIIVDCTQHVPDQSSIFVEFL